MIVLLDDLSYFLYRKMKSLEDRHYMLSLTLSYKKKLLAIHSETWLLFIEQNMIDADAVYRCKFLLEREIAKLEQEINETEKRMMTYVYDSKKNRSDRTQAS